VSRPLALRVRLLRTCCHVMMIMPMDQVKGRAMRSIIANISLILFALLDTLILQTDVTVKIFPEDVYVAAAAAISLNTGNTASTVLEIVRNVSGMLPFSDSFEQELAFYASFTFLQEPVTNTGPLTDNLYLRNLSSLFPRSQPIYSFHQYQLFGILTPLLFNQSSQVLMPCLTTLAQCSVAAFVRLGQNPKDVPLVIHATYPNGACQKVTVGTNLLDFYPLLASDSFSAPVYREMYSATDIQFKIHIMNTTVIPSPPDYLLSTPLLFPLLPVDKIDWTNPKVQCNVSDSLCYIRFNPYLCDVLTTPLYNCGKCVTCFFEPDGTISYQCQSSWAGDECQLCDHSLNAIVATGCSILHPFINISVCSAHPTQDQLTPTTGYSTCQFPTLGVSVYPSNNPANIPEAVVYCKPSENPNYAYSTWGLVWTQIFNNQGIWNTDNTWLIRPDLNCSAFGANYAPAFKHSNGKWYPSFPPNNGWRTRYNKGLQFVECRPLILQPMGCYSWFLSSGFSVCEQCDTSKTLLSLNGSNYEVVVPQILDLADLPSENTIICADVPTQCSQVYRQNLTCNACTTNYALNVDHNGNIFCLTCGRWLNSVACPFTTPMYQTDPDNCNLNQWTYFCECSTQYAILALMDVPDSMVKCYDSSTGWTVKGSDYFQNNTTNGMFEIAPDWLDRVACNTEPSLFKLFAYSNSRITTRGNNVGWFFTTEPTSRQKFDQSFVPGLQTGTFNFGILYTDKNISLKINWPTTVFRGIYCLNNSTNAYQQQSPCNLTFAIGSTFPRYCGACAAGFQLFAPEYYIQPNTSFYQEAYIPNNRWLLQGKVNDTAKQLEAAYIFITEGLNLPQSWTQIGSPIRNQLLCKQFTQIGDRQCRFFTPTASGLGFNCGLTWNSAGCSIPQGPFERDSVSCLTTLPYPPYSNIVNASISNYTTPNSIYYLNPSTQISACYLTVDNSNIEVPIFNKIKCIPLPPPLSGNRVPLSMTALALDTGDEIAVAAMNDSTIWIYENFVLSNVTIYDFQNATVHAMTLCKNRRLDVLAIILGFPIIIPNPYCCNTQGTQGQSIPACLPGSCINC
jgi:hypothetical protein